MQSNWKENQRLFNVIQSWFKRDLEIDKRDSNMIQHDSNVIQTWFKLDSTWFKGDIGGITRDWNSIKCAIQSWLKLNLTWLKTWFKLDSNLISDSIVIQTLFKRDTGPSGEEIVIQTWFGRNSCNFFPLKIHVMKIKLIQFICHKILRRVKGEILIERLQLLIIYSLFWLLLLMHLQLRSFR